MSLVSTASPNGPDPKLTLLTFANKADPRSKADFGYLLRSGGHQAVRVRGGRGPGERWEGEPQNVVLFLFLFFWCLAAGFRRKLCARIHLLPRGFVVPRGWWQGN